MIFPPPPPTPPPPPPPALFHSLLLLLLSPSHTHLSAVHGEGSEVVGILLVPGESQEGELLRIFVQDGGVLQVPAVGGVATHSDPSLDDHNKRNTACTPTLKSGVSISRQNKTSKTPPSLVPRPCGRREKTLTPSHAAWK